MALSDSIENNGLNTLLCVLEEHTAWFHKLIQHLFYDADSGSPLMFTKPTSFANWAVEANRQKSGIQPEVVEKLSSLHSDLFRRADALFDIVKNTREKPAQKDFVKLITIYEEFSLYIRRLEQDVMMEQSGYDLMTGLRSAHMLHNDLQQEMERFVRQGKSFCISMARIDHFRSIRKSCTTNEVDGYINLIANLIKLSVRSFDNAYHMGGGEFILSLKQTDISGGISALERLKKELERKKVKISAKDKVLELSLSCCIAEPVDGYEIKDLIKHLGEDLDKNASLEKSDTVLKYFELSPLQRYVQGNGDA